jgi:hypothetical protein
MANVKEMIRKSVEFQKAEGNEKFRQDSDKYLDGMVKIINKPYFNSQMLLEQTVNLRFLPYGDKRGRGFDGKLYSPGPLLKDMINLMHEDEK